MSAFHPKQTFTLGRLLERLCLSHLPQPLIPAGFVLVRLELASELLKSMVDKVLVLTKQTRVEKLGFVGNEAGPATERQNRRAPSGTSWSGATSTTAPCWSGKPSVSTSLMNGPICRGGKFTTAATRRPGSSSSR